MDAQPKRKSHQRPQFALPEDHPSFPYNYITYNINDYIIARTATGKYRIQLRWVKYSGSKFAQLNITVLTLYITVFQSKIRRKLGFIR